MNKRRKQGLVLLALSVPMMWWGFNQFIYGSGHSTLEAIAVSLSCTGGLTCFFGGLYLLFTKGRGEDLLASQTSEDSPIPDKIINKPSKKVNEMVETTSTSVEMMKREKELEARRKELEGLLKEVRGEETELEQSLQEKGWVKKDGEWGIE
jgi:hypothetical protein